MGSASAMSSINRFLERHAEAYGARFVEELPASLRALSPRAVLAGEVEHIAVFIEWGQEGARETLYLRDIDIDDLIAVDAAEFGGDCAIAY